MTLSPAARRQNADNLLRLLFAHVGLERDYDTVFFNAADDSFATTPPTTWQELVDWGRLKPMAPGDAHYYLTGSGWVDGLRLTGAFDEVRKRCPSLAIALKARVDRYSHGDERVRLEDLATATGFSKAFCFNVLQSRFFSECFPKRNMDVQVDYPFVLVPPTFAQPHVELFDHSSSSAVFP
jgi:hypothetical protein